MVGILAAVYFYMKGSGTSSSTATLVSQSAVDTTIGNKELVLLNQVKSINIDAAFFNNGMYQSLVDMTQAVPSVDIGRPDPFAPVPGLVSPLSTPGQSARTR